MPAAAPALLTSIDDAVATILASIDGPLRVAAPLGLGKPHRLLDALYTHLRQDPSRPLSLYTALSLEPPAAGSGLEQRFLEPFNRRLYGEDFPRLAYVEDRRRDRLPAHIRIEEFYMQSGALLDAPAAQRAYCCLNYTDAARTIAERGINLLVQKVASNQDGSRLSLSCNTDLTFDTLDALAARGQPRPLMVAEIDPQLPWLDGEAVVDAREFDLLLMPPPPYPRLFARPRQAVGDEAYAIGLFASTLVRDGGTLQIGIGALADALTHALTLRQTDNAGYRRILHALAPDIDAHPAVRASGGLGVFEQGLYGCSELLDDGFKRLVECGVVKRKVVDNEALMRRLAEGEADLSDLKLVERDGQWLHGAFYLGSADFHQWLRALPPRQRQAIGMRRISQVNALPVGHESLARLQRRDARFFNTCMLATALGAAVSDGLEDGRVVAGVGGQHDFVTLAHALPDARSVLMLRALRGHGRRAESNIRWRHGHITIPRQQRDLFVSQYGIADLRGKTDAECVIAMAAITDARFQAQLLRQARASAKIADDFSPPPQWRANTPAHLARTLAPFRAEGQLPEYPLGSDFTAVERRLARALSWLKQHASTPVGKLQALAASVTDAPAGVTADEEALRRMGLDAPASLSERWHARMLRLALHRSACANDGATQADTAHTDDDAAA